MTACIRGCAMLRRHLVECEDPETCRGCLPREAQFGWLCWPCHRRLELMLTQAEIVERWLTGNLPAGEGAAKVRQDWEQSRSSDGSPAPIKVAVYDVREHIGDTLAEYVDELCDWHTLSGPDRHTIAGDAAYLVTWLDRVELFDFVGDWFEHLGTLFSEAHSLAPWRPEAVKQKGIPCPECEECSLVVFGGESDVVCVRCKAIITPPRFRLWKLALIQEAERLDDERIDA